jgi:hypothetical protein
MSCRSSNCSTQRECPGGWCARRRSALERNSQLRESESAKTGAAGPKITARKQTKNHPPRALFDLDRTHVDAHSLCGRTSAFPGTPNEISHSLSLFSVCVALKAFMNYDFIVAAGSQINESCRCKAARRRSGFLPRAARSELPTSTPNQLERFN